MDEVSSDQGEMDDVERAAYDEFTAGDRESEAGNLGQAIRHYRRAARLFPSQRAVWINLAMSLLDTHRYSDARSAIDEAIRLDPDHADSWLVLGNILRSQKRYREAADAYEQVLRLESPPSQVALYNLGMTLVDLRIYDEAYDRLQAAFKLNPNEANTLFQLALAEGKLGLLDISTDHFSRAGELDPELWNDIADELRDLKLYSAAADAARNEILHRPENGWAYQKLDDVERAAYDELTAGHRESEAGNFGQAIRHYRRAARLLPSQLAAWTSLAMGLRDAHRYSDARRAIDEAIRLDPDDADSWFVLGNILRSQKRYREAADAYEQVLRLESPPSQDALCNLGRTLADLRIYDEAYDRLRAAFTLNPNEANTLFDLALVEGKLGLLDISAGHFSRAGELDPELWNYIAGELRDLKLYSAAADAARNEILQRPENGWAYQNLGHILKRSGLYKEAVMEYKKATEIDPDLLASFYHMALCLVRLRKYPEAKTSLIRCMEIEPSYKIVRDALKRVEKRLAQP